MARKKIIVTNSESKTEPPINKSECTSLHVNFKREFKKTFSKDLSYLLDGANPDTGSIKLEVAKFVSLVNGQGEIANII